MTHDEMIEVIRAHRDGKKIEWRCGGQYHWVDFQGQRWNFEVFEYRIKPEPREWWLDKTGLYAYQSPYHCNSCIHVREVLP